MARKREEGGGRTPLTVGNSYGDYYEKFVDSQTSREGRFDRVRSVRD